MPDPSHEDQLLQQAIAGEVVALEQLLWSQYDRLQRRIQRKIPAGMRGSLTAEDILQTTFVDAWKNIGTFTPQGDDAFYRWIATIAERKLTDRVRAQGAVKRGGKKAVAGMQQAAASSMVNLVDLVAGDWRSPSGSVAFREAERILTVALGNLKDDYRTAISMRYLQGKPIADIAKKLNRTERAVQMICNRSLKKLREALGRSSLYLSKR
ncbi:MAG: RNA polymerase sigma factor [Pirellulaceae bacterium]